MKVLGTTAAFVVIFLLIAAIVALVWQETAPVYTVTATLKVTVPAEPNGPAGSYLKRYLAFIESDPVLDEALASEQI